MSAYKELNDSKELEGLFGIDAAAEVGTKAIKNLKGSIISLWSAITSPAGIAVASIAAVGFALYQVATAGERANDAMRDDAGAYKDAQNDVTSLNSELDETNARIFELQAKGSLSLVEQNELNKLKEYNKELEIRKDLAEKTATGAAQDLAESSAIAYERNFTVDVSKGKTEDYLSSYSPDDALLLAFDSDEQNLSARIAGIKLLEKERDLVRGNRQEWLDKNADIQSAESSIWEQVELLQEYKTNLESIPYKNLTQGQRDTLSEIKNSIEYVYSELDPKTLNQWKLDEVLKNDTMSAAKKDLVDIAKKSDNVGISISDVEKRYGSLAKAIGNAYQKEGMLPEESAEAYRQALQDFVDAINSEAGIIDFSAVRKQLKTAFTGVGEVRNEFIDWIDKDLSESDLELLYKVSLDTDTATWKLKDWQNALDYAKANYSTIDVTISAEQDTASRVAAVRAEAFSPTGLSSESISAVESVFGDMEDYDYDKMFINSANGVQLNVDAFGKLQKQYEKTKKTKIENHIKDLRKQLEETTDAAKEATGAEKSRLDANADAISKQLQNAEELQSMYHGLTSAYNEYLQALETPNAGAQFDTIAEGYNKAKELLEAGRIGTDDFKSYMSLITGEDYDYVGGPQAAARAFENLGAKIKDTNVSWTDMLQGGQAGAEKFVQLLSEMNRGWVEIDETTGNLKFDFDAKEVADAIGTTEEMIDIQATNLTEYGLHIVDDDGIGTTEESIAAAEAARVKAEQLVSAIDAVARSTTAAKESATDANAALKEYGLTDYTFNFDSTSIENVNEEITKARNILSDFTDSGGQIDFSLEGAQEAFDVFTALVAQREKLASEEIPAMNIDASQVKGQLGEVVTAFQDAQNLMATRNVALEIGADTSDIDQAIIDEVSKIESMPAYIKGQLIADTESFDSALATLTSEDPSITVSAKMDAANTIESTLAAIPTQKWIDVGVNPESIANLEIENAKQHVDREYDPVITALENANQHVNRTWDPVQTTVASASQTVYRNYVDSGGSKAQGTAYVGGTAFARGNWGTKESGVALGGERGTEIVVRDGRWFTIGDNGAEFFNYKKNDIIFNAVQSEQILKYGKIKYGAKRGKAYADGTVGGKAFWSGSTPGFYKPTSSWLSSGSGSGSSSNSSSNKSSSSSDKEETFEKVDWIEIAIDRIERIIENFARTAESTFKTLGKRLIATSDQIESIKDEIYIQERAADRYLQEASNVGLSIELARNVRNGTIDINEYDEDTREQISEYQEWYEKHLEAVDAQEELTEQLAEAYQSRFDTIESDYENRLEALETQADRYESKMDELEERGYLATTKYYKEMQKVERQRISMMQIELVELQKSLTDAVNSGSIEEGSEAWHEMNNAISDVKAEIDDANVAIAEYAKTIREIEWDTFDYAIDRISKISDETNFLINLLGDEKMFGDDGKITSDGLAVMGLHAQNYNIAMEQSKKYATELAKVEKELSEDPYNTDLIERKEELLDLQQDAISAAQDEKAAIKDLVQEGIDVEVDALDKIITKYKDALKSAKDLHDYENKISEHTDDISSIQKQILAAEGDNSESGRANLQKLNKQLQEAQENLQETEYERDIEQQEQLLDEIFEEYQTVVNSRMDNVDVLINDMIDTVNNNATEINNTLIQATKDVGYTMSQSMRTIWQEATYGVNSAITSYTQGEEQKTTTIILRLNEIVGYVSNMAAASDDSAKTSINGIKKYAKGGLVKYTGLAQVDGTPSKPESFLDSNATKALSDFMNNIDNISKMNSDISYSDSAYQDFRNIPVVNMESINDVLKGIISTPISQSQNISYGDVNIDIERVMDYNDFMNQLKNDKKAEKMFESMIFDKMTGKSNLSKHKYSW